MEKITDLLLSLLKDLQSTNPIIYFTLAFFITLSIVQYVRIKNLKGMQNDFSVPKMKEIMELNVDAEKHRLHNKLIDSIPDLSKKLADLSINMIEQKLKEHFDQFKADYDELLFLAVDVYIANKDEGRVNFKEYIPLNYDLVKEIAEDVDKPRTGRSKPSTNCCSCKVSPPRCFTGKMPIATGCSIPVRTMATRRRRWTTPTVCSITVGSRSCRHTGARPTAGRMAPRRSTPTTDC